MDANREAAEAVIAEIKADFAANGASNPYNHDWSADWFDLCVPAELGVPHPPHAYETAEPSGCPGYTTPKPAAR